MHEDTIAVYDAGGRTCETGHLGVSSPDQWGEFMVYRDGEMIAGFCIPESSLKPEHRPGGLPVTTGELTELAKGAVAGDYASDDQVAAYLELQGMIGRNFPSAGGLGAGPPPRTGAGCPGRARGVTAGG